MYTRVHLALLHALSYDMPDRGLTSEAVAKRTGYALTTCRKELNLIVREGFAKRNQHGRYAYWQLINPRDA